MDKNNQQDKNKNEEIKRRNRLWIEAIKKDNLNTFLKTDYDIHCIKKQPISKVIYQSFS